ncbi:MAG: serine/threonine-protein kinase [Pseudomonadota bacterium]|nr:serine/threonine-protein kinase [Pseudomonadota bacterium]
MIKKLGAGTFGEVWLIPWEDGYAVLKVLKHPTPDNRERFAREARMLLRHRENPHVLCLLHQEVDGVEPYFIVEHCDGGSLDKVLEAHGVWSATQVAYLIAHVAAGLDVIHGERGYHRDLKPANILLKWTNRELGAWTVKVGDFGLAREPDSRSATMTASPHGTPAYMPPEVQRGGHWTPAGDIYSLGITGIEMLTGSRERAGLRSATCPVWLRDLLLQMTVAELRARPSIQQVGVTVRVNLAPKQQVEHRPSPKPKEQTSSGWGWLLGGMAAATALALATMNTRDANGRFHGDDGQFRSGRWG